MEHGYLNAFVRDESAENFVLLCSENPEIVRLFERYKRYKK